jgi:hypothetical protein
MTTQRAAGADVARLVVSTLGRDRLALVVAPVAALVFALRGFQGVLHRDVALYAYGAQRFVDGLPPYVGVLNRAGPLAHAGPAPGVVVARVFGFDELLGMRVWYLVVSVAVVVGVYLLCRDLFRSRGAGLLGAVVMLSAKGFLFYATSGPREKTLMLAFVVFALHAAVRKRWFVAGVLVSLATLTWQPAFLTVVSVALLALRESRTSGWRALVRVVAGGMLPLVVVVAYYALAATVDDFLLGFLRLNFTYTTADPVELGTQLLDKVLKGYGWSTWTILLGLVGFLGMVVAAAVAHVRGALAGRVSWLDPSDVLVIAVTGLLLVYWTWSDFDGWPDLFPVLPVAAVGAAAIACAVQRTPMPARVARGALVIVVLAGLGLGAYGARVNNSAALQRQAEAASLILDGIPSDVEVLAIQAPQPLALESIANPIRYQMFASGMQYYVDDTWPDGLTGFGRWIRRQRFGVIFTGNGFSPHRVHVGGMMRKHYIARGAPGWDVYIRRDLVAGDKLPTWAPAPTAQEEP